MTDLTALTDTTQLNTPTDHTNSAISRHTPSHGEEQEYTITNGTNEDSESGQELTRMCTLEPSNKQDAESATLEHSGTVTGCAEAMQDHHAIGYKREHSHSPVRQCSQTSPVQVHVATCAFTAASCLVESQQELVVDGGALDGGGDQREERQPRKRVKRETMEGEGGEGNGRK